MADLVMEYIKCILMTICGIFLTIPLVLLLLPVIVFFGCLSVAAYALSFLKYRGKIMKARGTDVIHGKERALSLPIINIGVRINGDMCLPEIKAKLFRIIDTTRDAYGQRRYRKLMDIYEKSFGYYIYRESDTFAIDNHVRVVHMPPCFENEAPPTWEILTQRMLNTYGHEKFRSDVPQWELILVKENEKRYTGIFRIHHAMADGIYLARMFCEDFLDKPVKLYTSYTPPSKLIKILTSFWSFFLLPFGIMKVALNSDENPLHGATLSGKKKYFVTKSIPVRPLQEAKTQSGVSMNCILFTLVSYALENHFKRKSTLVPNVTALTPVPLQNPWKPIKMKNKFAVASLALPTDFSDKETLHARHNVEAHKEQLMQNSTFRNQLTRLNSVQKVLSGMKRDPSLLAANSLMNTLCYVLPAVLAEAMISAKGCTICISNVPGPGEELHIWSGTQEEMMFWVPDRTPIGIGVSFMSYNGHLRIGLIVDTGLSKHESEGEMIVRDFEKEVENILETVKLQQNQNEKEQNLQQIV